MAASTSETEEFSGSDPMVHKHWCSRKPRSYWETVSEVMEDDNKVIVKREGSHGRQGLQRGRIRDLSNVRRKQP